MLGNTNCEIAEELSIEDPRVPGPIRRHAARFRTKVEFVSFVGNDIVLTASDDEVVAICALDD